jgi:hypothetical protein
LIPFETVTVITIGAILAIVTAYLLILKKNGWIGNHPIQRGSIESLQKTQQDLKIRLETLSKQATVSAAKKENKEPAPPAPVSATIKSAETKTQQVKTCKKNDATQKDVPAGCNHSFGYLSTVPKGTATPDECYLCAKLIDCYKQPKN